jgi:hypothetical protein
MMNRMFQLLIVVLLAAAACTSQQSVPPTLTPSPEMPTEVPTEPPTARPIERATLPPTWTPAAELTNTPLPTEVAPPTPAPLVVPTLPEACNDFAPDINRSPRRYAPDQEVTIYWTVVEGAEYYSIKLFDEEGSSALLDYTAEAEFTFPAELFNEGLLYGWEAYPIDDLGNQMCLSVGMELFPNAIP